MTLAPIIRRLQSAAFVALNNPLSSKLTDKRQLKMNLTSMEVSMFWHVFKQGFCVLYEEFGFCIKN